MAATAKATFNLHIDVLDALSAAVADGAAPSKNALVERALRAELEALRRKRREAQWQEAGRDPLFLKDIREVDAAFAAADAETARSIE
jgi:hypothetical protein